MSLFKYFTKSPAVKKKKVDDEKRYLLGDLVWAKLLDFPWWPCMVCKEPKSGKIFQQDKVHVQFFGQPPTRDWVLKRNLQSFGDRKPNDAEGIEEAFIEASDALKLSNDQRIDKYYVDGVSESEEDEQEDIKNNNKMNANTSTNDNGDEDDLKNGRKRSLNGNNRSRKRMKLCIESDPSEDEDDNDASYEPEQATESSDEEMLSEHDESDSSISKSTKKKKSITSTPKVNGKSSTKVNVSQNNSFFEKTPAKSATLNTSVSRAQTALAKFSSPSATPPPSPSPMADVQQYLHHTLKFLKDGNRRDKKGKLHTDPDYDCRTLLVPQSFINSKEVTPGMKQWWELKSDMYDTVIFFKVGKFYEFYHMDAEVGVKELGLLYMKGKFAHCGFPEVAFSRYSDILVQRGYKVARIEQTETPQALSARGGGKVVRREVCAVITKGTRTYGVMEGAGDESSAAYLLAFLEKPCVDGQIGESEFGVCFVDTSIGKFYLGQFVDDRQCSRFLTMISQFPPVQILYEKKGLSPKVSNILNNELLASIKEPLNPGSEFWDSSKTLHKLHKENYFNDENKEGPVQWPPLLEEILKEGDMVGLEAPSSFQLAISALGACTWYLKKCCIEQELLSMCQFQKYIPPDDVSQKKKVNDNTFSQHMILDGVTLTNLDIIRNVEGGTQGTLLELLDHCSTVFGKRYFTQWLCTPLCHKNLIEARLDAVEDLMANAEYVNRAKGIMRTIPDLDRILRRIHAMGSLRRSKDHPEGRAVYFNIDVFSKKKIADLLSAIEGFKRVVSVIKTFNDVLPDFKSSVLKNLLTFQGSDKADSGFPDLKPALRFFEVAFDHQVAKETGKIHPKPGVLTEYDIAKADIESVNLQLNDYVKKQRKRLGVHNITYWGTGKNRFQLEVPESALRSSTPNDYHLKSQKKGFKRFYTDFIEEMIKKLTDAEERRDSALQDTLRNIFNKFDKEYNLWQKAVRHIATLDCLMSLSVYSQNIGDVSCRPEIVDVKDENGTEIQPFIEIRNSRHPCAGLSWKGDDFIPNDILLGVTENGEKEEAKCVLITGPNMGGKSTLMRQAGTLLIMAQLGCYVPAEVCRFTPVDRVFTRLGARDRIMHGESTFFVELSETSTIFQHATKHSLVLLDELGRGTATFDGTAIASAVVNDLSTRYKCRTFFSTHYHSLVDDFTNNPGVKLGHMACMVEKDDEEVDDPTEETITFLYKFISGACPKSYGFNAAALAGIPKSVIKRTHEKAVDFETSSKNLRKLRLLINGKEENLRHLLGKPSIAAAS